MRAKLSTLWIFATLNYLYCDVVTLMDQDKLQGFLAGRVGGVEVTQGFLFAAGILVEIPMAMIVLERMLPRRVNRWANVVAGGVMTAVQAGTLFAGMPAPYYVFFSLVEIGATAAIVWLAWRWSRPLEGVETVPDLEQREPERAWAHVSHHQLDEGS